MAQAWAETIETMSEPFRYAGITQVAGIESRGFFLGGGIARSLHAGATVAGAALMIELEGLDGRSKVKDVDPLHILMRLPAG